MLEDSIESFTARWRRFAVTAWLYPRVEGSPLLECEVAGRIVHLFERTNPYAGPVGSARVIVHGVTDELRAGEGEPFLEVLGTSRLRLGGRIVELADKMLVVDAGLPVVIGLLGTTHADGPAGQPMPDDATEPTGTESTLTESAYGTESYSMRSYSVGSYVELETLPPLHGFVLGDMRFGHVVEGL